MKESRWTIYCHTHIESGRKYIGLTSQTWQKRWKNHISASKSSKDGRWHFPNAIRKYGPEAFDHKVLAICDTLEEANAAEQRHILDLDTRNPEKGFNLAPGGSHTPHPIKNPWDRPEFRAAAIERSRAMWQDPALRAKASASHLGVKLSPEHCACIAEARRGKDHSPEVRERINSSVRETYERPEVRAKNAASSRALWQDPSFREKIQIGVSEAIRAKWYDPTYRAKQIKYTETHKLCQEHGWVSLTDCYRRSRNGICSFECKLCVSVQQKCSRSRRKRRV